MLVEGGNVGAVQVGFGLESEVCHWLEVDTADTGLMRNK